MSTAVDAMPREWQMKCLGAMIYYVDNWDERQQAPGLSDRENGTRRKGDAEAGIAGVVRAITTT